MPVKVKKADGFRVSTPGSVKAKSTTKEKAERQKRLLNAIEHGFKPTGKKARDKGKEVGGKTMPRSTRPVRPRRPARPTGTAPPGVTEHIFTTPPRPRRPRPTRPVRPRRGR